MKKSHPASQKSIFMITSNLGPVECWKDKKKVVEWVRRGVSVKIMAPVTSENLDIANQLLKICEVKHVPADYVETIIVDRQHLFQFKTLLSEEEPVALNSYFENTFYTNDSEYVEKTENMLTDIWNNCPDSIINYTQSCDSTTNDFGQTC